ncbi:MAG TPA: aminotransferase class IV [Gaiellales bacterium]|nr:aminotransferase class IV [Gaiellales bacterium]
MSGDPLALAVLGHGLVDPSRPWLRADDEAVLRGRAAFETLRVYGGRPFRLAEHLDRLTRSAEVLELDEPDAPGLEGLVGEALGGLGAVDAVLRLVWTPGAGHGPTGFALVTPLPEGADAMRARGIELATLQLAIGTTARQASPWLLAGVKSTSYAVNMAAQHEARKRGADDALFLSLEGIALECPTSNVWFVEDGVLHTPGLDLGILAGVTRDTLLAAAAEARMDVEEGAYPRARLAAAAEVFTSSSVREVMPVVRMDGGAVGDGRPGPIAAAMQAALRRAAS